MPNTPINIFDLNINRRNIRRNLSNQIVSYTLEPDSTLEYGLKRIPAVTTFYKTDAYNRTIDNLSDELVVDIPNFQPIPISSNFINQSLFFAEGEQPVPVGSLKIYDAGNHNFFYGTGINGDNRHLTYKNNERWDYIVFPDANGISANIYSPGVNYNDFGGDETKNEGPPTSPFNPTRFPKAPGEEQGADGFPKELFYYPPLQPFSQFYTKNNGGILSEPFIPYWKGGRSWSCVSEFSWDSSLESPQWKNILYPSLTGNEQLYPPTGTTIGNALWNSSKNGDNVYNVNYTDNTGASNPIDGVVTFLANNGNYDVATNLFNEISFQYQKGDLGALQENSVFKNYNSARFAGFLINFTDDGKLKPNALKIMGTFYDDVSNQERPLNARTFQIPQ
jgi:hypothetical protein